MQPGRNDPCPCGSGKKYKHCHGSEVAAPAASGTATAGSPHASAVSRALTWLNDRHRKGMQVAFGQLLLDLGGRDALPRIARHSHGVQLAVQINLNEWLLAEGSIFAGGQTVPVAAHVLGADGPAFEPAQREWIAQLTRQPLRVYEVLAVEPGQRMTLRDWLDPAAAPLEVREATATQQIAVGDKLGCRLMQVDGTHQMSGASYNLPAPLAQALEQSLRDTPPGSPRELGLRIMSAWLTQIVPPTTQTA